MQEWARGILKGEQWTGQTDTSFLVEHEQTTLKFFDEWDTDTVELDEVKKFFFLLLKH